ncbi:MAG: minor capsid protein [Clostridia bacterium]|nr:minor capsid protein [Clostridia bacterium]
MTRTPYQITDEAVAKITKKLHRQFRHNRLALFDEMNVIGVKKHINKLYKDIYKIIKNEFVTILNSVYQEIYDEAIALGFDGELRNLDEAWIEEFFGKYSPVTKYVFSNEIDRKESYLFEAIVSDPSFSLQSYAKAERLLVGQIKQYAIELEDDIAKVVYEDTGVEKVQWVAKIDYKTCSDCGGLNGEIFDLDEAPEKQHYGCRCYLIPVKE